MEGFRISSDIDEMDLSLIHDFLSNTYWAKGIPREILRRALKNSLCFGVFGPDGSQVGFARVITDSATFAYSADVFIVDEHRGAGLSKCLMQNIVEHPRLANLRRFVLATRDAHGLYEQFGFKPLAHPDTFMEIWVLDIYTKAQA